MNTFSLTFGYLCFILALQVLRRRSPAMLPHLAAFAILPVLSLTLDFEGLSGRHETAFTAGFLGVLAGHLALLVLVNRSWAAQAATMHPNGFPTGVTGRERLKFLLAGIALFLVHRQYERPDLSLYELLDRGAFWLILLLVGVSAIRAFIRYRRTVRNGVGIGIGMVILISAAVSGSALGVASPGSELAALLFLSEKAVERYERWDASLELSDPLGYQALSAMFAAAKRSEEVFLLQVRDRVLELGGEPVKIRQIYSDEYLSSRRSISSAIALLKEDRDAVAAVIARVSFPPSTPAGRAVVASQKALGWLHDRCLVLESRPDSWRWWKDEYLVCATCGMPRMALGRGECRVCGAGYLDALRIR